MYVSKKNEFGVTSSPRPGVDSENYLGMVALLGTLETGFSQVKVNRFPAPVGIDFDSDRSEMARNRKEFIELAAENIEHVTAWVSKQEAAIEAATRR